MDYKNKFKKKVAALEQTGNLFDITRDEVDRNCSLLGYYSASCGNFLPTSGTTYRSILREVMCPIFKLTPEDGTDDFAAETRNQTSRQET
jgi:hypothetical protein